MSGVGGGEGVCWRDPLQRGLAVAFAWGEEAREDALDERLEGHDAGARDGRVDFDCCPVDHVGAGVAPVVGCVFRELDEGDEADNGDDADAEEGSGVRWGLQSRWGAVCLQETKSEDADDGVFLSPREVKGGENRHLRGLRLISSPLENE